MYCTVYKHIFVHLAGKTLISLPFNFVVYVTYMHNHSDGNTMGDIKIVEVSLIGGIYVIRIDSETSVIYREVCFIWKVIYCRHEAASFKKTHSLPLCCCSVSICGISTPEDSTM